MSSERGTSVLEKPSAQLEESSGKKSAAGNASKPFHLPNLSALRFIAATSVILFHIEHKKTLFGFASLWEKSFFVSNVGYHAVTFFFVLSGFLITSLLLKEKEQSGAINLKNFYVRRILRIFPVYYATLIIGFLILPHFQLFNVPEQTQNLQQHFVPAALLSFAFLSNVALSYFGNMAAVDQSWSVSVEEQFYLFWPLVIGCCNRKFLPYVLLSILLVSFGLRFGLHDLGPFWKMITYLNRFGCMAIGGLAALLLYHRDSGFYKFITKPWFFALTLGLLWFNLSFNFIAKAVKLVEPEVYSLLFAVILLNVSVQYAKKIRLDSPLFIMLGNMSYSIYMYHNIFIALACNLLLLKIIPAQSGLYQNLFLYGFVVTSTMVASYISYKFMERPLLKLKEKFAIIKSSA